MLSGELIGLRARLEADIEVFEAEMLNDVEMRVRADGRPWRPIAPGSADSPYRAVNERGDAVPFSVVELATAELAGEAVLWGIDTHHRNAHLGLGLRPAYRGRHLGTDIVRVLCHYGFGIRGLHRLQVETLADNHAMIAAATRAGFALEGTLRDFAWIDGQFADAVILSQLVTDWSPPAPSPKET
jgi:RimJ/RimL family protein N-acetyltransferase